MKRTLALLFAVFGIVGLVSCGGEPPARDLDAYVCGDAERDEDDREDDPRDIQNADCIEVYDETDAEDGDTGDCLFRIQDGAKTGCDDGDDD